jgi:SAM-dependent methyltransferase
MAIIERTCPLGHAGEWVPRRGALRDLKSVGVIECSLCGHVVHEEDVSEVVDYSMGSMRNPEWSKGYGELAPPKADRSRRVGEVKSLLQGGIEPHVILDVGCGDGTMIREFEESGLVAYGLDPDRTAAAADVQSKIVTSFEDLPLLGGHAMSPNLISAYHVIEHVYEPVSFLKKLFFALSPGGKVIIETPNANDALLKRFECSAFESFTYWSHHPHLYSATSLEGTLTLAGFKDIKVSGSQRYGLANHLLWLSKGSPGGHESWRDLVGSETELLYAEDLAKLGLSDTLTATAVRP